MKTLTETTYSEALRTETKPIVLDFYADWCGPCGEMAPITEAAAEEFAETLSFYKINIDDSPVLAAEFSVACIPTLVFLKNGKETGRSVGLLSKGELAETLQKLL